MPSSKPILTKKLLIKSLNKEKNEKNMEKRKLKPIKWRRCRTLLCHFGNNFISLFERRGFFKAKI